MLFQRAKRGELILLVQDEKLINIVATRMRTWLPKGSRSPKVSVPQLRASPKERTAVFGALNVLTGHCHRLYAPRVIKEHFLRFIKRLAWYYRQMASQVPVYLVIDGHSAHSAHVVQRWLRTHPQLRIYRLPKNSPELNPIEYLWKLLRKEVTHLKPYRPLRAIKISATFQRWVCTLTENIWTSNTLIHQVG
ncbi:MAG: transposase [Promethearchaeota archaeon]